jgi:hypothetical protein
VLQFCGLLKTDPTYSAAQKAAPSPRALARCGVGAAVLAGCAGGCAAAAAAANVAAGCGAQPVLAAAADSGFYVLLHTASAGLGDSCLRQWLPRSSRSPALLRLSPKSRSRAGAAGARGAVQAGAPSLAVVCSQGVWHQLVLYRRVWLQVQGEMLPRLVAAQRCLADPARLPACSKSGGGSSLPAADLEIFREPPWDGICCSQCAAGRQPTAWLWAPRGNHVVRNVRPLQRAAAQRCCRGWRSILLALLAAPAALSPLRHMRVSLGRELLALAGPAGGSTAALGSDAAPHSAQWRRLQMFDLLGCSGGAVRFTDGWHQKGLCYRCSSSASPCSGGFDRPGWACKGLAAGCCQRPVKRAAGAAPLLPPGLEASACFLFTTPRSLTAGPQTSESHRGGSRWWRQGLLAAV